MLHCQNIDLHTILGRSVVFVAILVLLNINILLPTSGENCPAILGIKSEEIADNFIQHSAWFGEKHML